MAKSSLQAALEAMRRAPEDVARRITYFNRLIDTELVLALETEDEEDTVTPKSLIGEKGEFVLTFEDEAAFADYVSDTSPYVAVSGRNLVSMLEGQGVGIVMNAAAPDGGFMIDAQTVSWLVSLTGGHVQQDEGSIVQISQAPDMSDADFTALSHKLATAQGLADFACLVTAEYSDQRSIPVLFFVGEIPGSQTALVQIISEFRNFLGAEGSTWDVAFCADDDPRLEKIERVGIRIDIPKPTPAIEVKVPGSDPSKPPIFH